MKRIIILSLFLAIFTNVIISQNETQLPIGRKWVMHLTRIFLPSYSEIRYYEVTGDTMINNNKYSVVDYCDFIRWEGTKCLRFWTETQSDTLVFDESWNLGDTTSIYDERGWYFTVDNIDYIQGRKHWDVHGGYYHWLKGIGYIDLYPFHVEFSYVGAPSRELICCIDPGNDTLYVNRDLLHLLPTGIENTTAEDISFKQQGGECIVTLPGEAAAWSATLSNSSGITVARRSGEGSEIILPATSKGTHILVVKADGKVVKKKVFIK